MFVRLIDFSWPKKISTAVIVLAVIFVLQIAGGLVIGQTMNVWLGSMLDDVMRRTQADVSIDGDNWDISKYNTDPAIKGGYRLYIFSNDGFVVDRQRPIGGFFDISNFKQQSEYTDPQTIHTITGQEWRMYSRIISDSDQEVGVISVASPGPFASNISDVDHQLKQTAAQIASKVRVKNGQADASAVDNRLVPIGTPFQIVNKYNRILAKSQNSHSIDQLPDTIDATYVLRGLERSGTKQATDTKTGESFLTASRPLMDNNGNQRGVVIASLPLAANHFALKTYAIFWITIDLLAMLPLLILAWRRRNRNRVIPENTKLLRLQDIESISFVKSENSLQINQHKIPLTYATNQYYLCIALLTSRRRIWETDELIEKFGEQHGDMSWRKVYDTMVNLNKKTSQIMEPKLIITNNKTYQLNPELQEKIR